MFGKLYPGVRACCNLQEEEEKRTYFPELGNFENVLQITWINQAFQPNSSIFILNELK